MPEAQVIARIERVEADVRDVDDKVSEVKVQNAALAERVDNVLTIVRDLKATLDKRNEDDAVRRRNDRAAIIAAAGGVLVALIGAVALVITSGVLG